MVERGSSTLPLKGVALCYRQRAMPRSIPASGDILFIVKADGLYDVSDLSALGLWEPIRSNVMRASARTIAFSRLEPGGRIWSRLEAKPNTAVKPYKLTSI